MKTTRKKFIADSLKITLATTVGTLLLDEAVQAGTFPHDSSQSVQIPLPHAKEGLESLSLIMAKIYHTENFVVEMINQPMITREDGGHLVINPKVRISDRTKLTPSLAIEFMRLSMIVGEAMQTALNNRGIDVGRINYQDNGNWAVFKPEGPHFHLHLYGRAKSAKIQKYGEACHLPLPHTGFYEGLEPLNEGDLQAIREEIEKLESSEKYALSKWHL